LVALLGDRSPSPRKYAMDNGSFNIAAHLESRETAKPHVVVEQQDILASCASPLGQNQTGSNFGSNFDAHCEVNRTLSRTAIVCQTGGEHGWLKNAGDYQPVLWGGIRGTPGWGLELGTRSSVLLFFNGPGPLTRQTVEDFSRCPVRGLPSSQRCPVRGLPSSQWCLIIWRWSRQREVF
jgi:hypothetical protein